MTLATVPVKGLRPRDNPFTSQRIHALAWRPPPGAGGVSSVGELAVRLDGLGGRGALVGPHGHGKSTLLEELGDHLVRRSPDLVPSRLTAGRDRRPERHELGGFLRGVTSRHLLLVDGFDHLPPWTRWRIRRAAGPAAALVVTSHRVPRHTPGGLPTLLHCTTTPALLADLVDELLAGAPPAVSPPPVSLPPLPSAADLHRRHAGNLRDALHELYDRCAGRWRECG